MKIAAMGMGNVRCAPAIIASLSGYFGERPLEIFFWDADFERLDLFDRFARLLFHMNQAKHSLQSTEESEEALEGAAGLILCVEDNCAKKFLLGRGSLIGHGETEGVLVNRCVSELLVNAPLNTSVLSLLDFEPDGHPWSQADWPEAPNERDITAIPFQILRYINGEDYAHALMKDYKSSPLTEWLDLLTSHSA